MNLTLTVPGQPVGMQRHRHGRGRVWIPAPTREYQQRVETAWQADGGRVKLEGPLSMSATFVLGRPKSHLRKDGTPRPSAPKYPSKPDVDNLLKAVLDALNDKAYSDDSQVTRLDVCLKRYAAAGEEPHTELSLTTS